MAKQTKVKVNEVKAVILTVEEQFIAIQTDVTLTDTERFNKLQELQDTTTTQALNKSGGSVGGKVRTMLSLPIMCQIYNDTKERKFSSIKSLLELDETLKFLTLTKELNTPPKTLLRNKHTNKTEEVKLPTDLLYAHTLTKLFKEDLLKGLYTEVETFKGFYEAINIFALTDEVKTLENKERILELDKFKANLLVELFETDKVNKDGEIVELALFNTVAYNVSFIVLREESELKYKVFDKFGNMTTKTRKNYNKFMLVGGLEVIKLIASIRGVELA